MQISANGIAFVKQCEGFSPVPYADAGGRMTIGYGHAIRPGEHFARVTEAEAEALLRADLCQAAAAVNRLVSVPMTQGQFDALADFVFNEGEGSFARSTLLTLLNAGDYAGAADQLPRWHYATGLSSDGLLRRREMERALFLKSTTDSL